MKRALTITTLLCAFAAAAHAQSDPMKKPQLALSPSTIDFGGEAGTKSFKISNTGNADLEIEKVQPAPDAYGFLVLGATTRTLKPGETMDVTVQFTPDGKRQQAFGGIQVFSNDETFPQDERGGAAHITGVAARSNNSWLLTAMIFFPLIGGLIILAMPSGKENLVRWIALATAAVPVGLAGFLYLHYDRAFGMAQGNYGLQFIHHTVWIPSFNVEYFVGVDGISITMVILTALVSLVAVGASWNISKQVK